MIRKAQEDMTDRELDIDNIEYSLLLIPLISRDVSSKDMAMLLREVDKIKKALRRLK